VKTAILGAGVSGLALAQKLIQGGLPREDVVLFEASARAGGLCASKTVNGFTYDETGGHVLFSKDTPVMEWMIAEAGGHDAFHKVDRNTKIRFEDRWVHYPFENGLGDLPAQANFECLSGYVQAWHARQMNDSAAPADFAAWIEWRFGPGICDHFMRPYNEKIWKRDLSEITSSWVAGRVPDAPIDDVLRASIGIRTEGYTHQSIFYYPKQGGFQGITDGLYNSLTDRVRLSTPVTSLTKHGETFKVNGEEFDCVVNTIPMNLVPAFCDGLDRAGADAMRALANNQISCFLLALDRPEHPPLSWVYLPHHNQGPANRITYMSNYATSNAPEGQTSFLCEVTSPGGGAYPDANLVDEVVAGMQHAGLLRKEEILFTDRTDTRWAYIVYDHGFEAKKANALAAAEAYGLEMLGRFGRYDYHNSDQCVIQATALAGRLLQRADKGHA
jgi:protoporphyrinogen oxidase